MVWRWDYWLLVHGYTLNFIAYQNLNSKNYSYKTIKTQNFKLEVSYAALKSYSIQSPFIC
jgi:hypothetical protein